MDLVKTAPNVQLHLVMSVAAGARELAAIAQRYKGYGPERLVFTKIDEAAGPAGAVTAAGIIGRPVSCLCDGQRVPEDIHAVTDASLLDRFLAPLPVFLPTRPPRGYATFNQEQVRGPGR
jgi:flagellar biosynthesis protein FlhF